MVYFPFIAFKAKNKSWENIKGNGGRKKEEKEKKKSQ